MIKKLFGLSAATFAWLAAAVLGLTLLSPPARGQVTERPPSCSPFTAGVGHVLGQAGGAAGAHWWCPPADPYGDWVPARAARLLEAGQMPEVRSEADVEALVAARTLPTTAPAFAPLWDSMATQVAASRPAPRWRVAAAAAGTRPAYRVTDAGGVAEMPGFRMAVGAPCDCRQRVTSGSTTYCQASFTPRIVAVCTRS